MKYLEEFTLLVLIFLQLAMFLYVFSLLTEVVK